MLFYSLRHRCAYPAPPARRSRRSPPYETHDLRRGRDEFLAAYEVDTVFGMAGTMTVELYRGIALAGIRHVQCRNEQGASLMADGYARATGKPGVCTIIAGPGVTNAATGIAQAYCDSQPMLVLSGACATRTHGKRLGSGPRAQRSGGGYGRVHRIQRHGPISRGGARVDRPRLCRVSRQPTPSGASVSAARRPPGNRRGRLEDPPFAVLADARSGGDRGGRGAPCAGKASSDSCRRRRGRHAHGADRHRRAYRGAGSLHQCGQGDPPGIPPLSLGCSIVQKSSQQALADADVVLLVGSQVGQGDHFLPKLDISGDIIRIDIDPTE